MDSSPLTKKQLEQRLFTLHQASLQLVQDISIDSLLEKIAALACQEADALPGTPLRADPRPH